MQEGHTYKDGSHVWLAVPEISPLQYHPFCVASTSSDPRWARHLLLQIKVYDKWTAVCSHNSLHALEKVSAKRQSKLTGP